MYSEIDFKKLMFLGRLITEPEMAPVVRFLFSSRVDSFFDANITSRGVLPSICDACTSITCFIILNYGSVNAFFPHTRTGKQS